MPDLLTAVDVARDAVAKAAVVCRHVQAQLDSVREMTKDDKSPVTVADYASQAVVAHCLRESLGEVVLVAEEDADFLRAAEHAGHLRAALEAVRLVWPEADEAAMLEAVDIGSGEPVPEGFWTLDPIDGTKGFLRGQQYAVALAWVEAGRPVAAAMGCPNLPRDLAADLTVPDAEGSLYVAALGAGVREGPCTSGARLEDLRVHPQADDAPVRVTGSVEKAHTNVSDEDRILQVFAGAGVPVGEPARLDSQCKYAVVARGQADAYLRLPTKPGYVERIWDHAAGALVATEAGCVVSDIFGSDLDFSRGRGLEANKGVVCASARSHQRFVDAIREVGIVPA